MLIKLWATLNCTHSKASASQPIVPLKRTNFIRLFGCVTFEAYKMEINSQYCITVILLYYLYASISKSSPRSKFYCSNSINCSLVRAQDRIACQSQLMLISPGQIFDRWAPGHTRRNSNSLSRNAHRRSFPVWKSMVQWFCLMIYNYECAVIAWTKIITLAEMRRR